MILLKKQLKLEELINLAIVLPLDPILKPLNAIDT